MKLLFGGFIAICLSLLIVQPVMAQTQNSSVTINAVVPGQPPATAPTIDSPVSGTHSTEQQITVSGTCLPGLVVKVFRNEIFAGSTLCEPGGIFLLQIDLLEDQNDLVARQYDLLSQPSPSSETVSVFYVVTQPGLSQESPQTARFQLVIDYDYNFQGIFINEPFNLPVHFAGGEPSYAVSIDWGDGQTKVYSREDASQFHAEYTYAQAGPKIVKIHVSDKEGQVASLQFVLIVNGGPVAAQPLQPGGGSSAQEDNQVSWQAAVATTIATSTASFGAGVALASLSDTVRMRIRSRFKITPPGGP